MKNYKLITGFNTQQEKTIYFDRLTARRLKDLCTDNYILLSFTPIGCYIAIDYKLDENNKRVFNANPRRYCGL